MLSIFVWYTQHKIVFPSATFTRGSHLESRVCEIFREKETPSSVLLETVQEFERKRSLKMSSQVQSLQKQLTQLRQEANVNRIPVSEAIQE